MDDHYSLYENQLLHALIIALLANKQGDAMNDSAIKNCLVPIEQHCQIGNISKAFDMAFIQFTGYLYHRINGKRHTIGTLRFNNLGRASIAKISGQVTNLPHLISTIDRTEQYHERKKLLCGVY